MSYYLRSLRVLGLAAFAGITFIAVDFALRVGIVMAFGLDHALLTIVAAVVARSLLIFGYAQAGVRPSAEGRSLEIALQIR